MKINRLFFLAFILLLAGSGCVSTQKFNDMMAARDHFKAESERLKLVEKENDEFKVQLRAQENRITQTTNDLTTVRLELEKSQLEYKLMSERYEAATSENSRLIARYSSDKRTYEEKLSATEDELIRKERQLKGLEETLGLQSSNLNNLRVDLEVREKRVFELEKAVAEKEAQMAQLRNSLKSALRGFSESDLSVSERNGKIYVSLSQNLLFKTGSDKVDAKGESALKQLASALKDNPGIEIIVEGHTDNVGGVDLNWDLSTRRATSVVKILGISGVSPDRLMAAGRGMHQPIVPNSTEENRSRNRRTEIILSPNMDKLMEMIR